MDCTYSYFAPDPENAKNRSDPGSSIDSGRDTLQSASEKSGEKDPPLRYQGCRQAFDSVSVGLFLSFGTYCSVLCRCIGALFCRGKVLVEGSTGFGSLHRIFQNVFVQFGNWTGIKWFAQQWFTTPESSFWALVIVMTWSLSGYLMIIYNSGLAAISKDYYEAATVDGASKLTILKSITLPLLKGTTTRCLFIAINWAMLLYDTNISLTNGNPYRTSEGVIMNKIGRAHV